MIIKEKKNCTITIMDRGELGLNSAPYVKSASPSAGIIIDSEVHQMMINHGMTREEAEAVHKENIEWAASWKNALIAGRNLKTGKRNIATGIANIGI